MNGSRLPRATPSIVLACSLVAAGAAAGQAHDTPSDAEEHEHETIEHQEGVTIFKNEIAFVLGGTYESEEEKTLFTIGLEYAREINHRWAISAVAEHLSDIDAWVFVTPFHYNLGRIHPHPQSHFLLAFGPGIEAKSRRVIFVEHEDHGEIVSEPEIEQAENLFLWRTGIKYAIHTGGRWSIWPALDLDLVREGDEWVYAVVFDVEIGLGF